MKINLLIIFFLAFSNIFAQEISDQFLSGLAKSIYNQDKVSEENIVQLNYYAKIHPNLIYYYLNSILIPDNASISALVSNTNHYIDKKNRWIDSLYNKIDVQLENKSALEEISSFLSKHKSTPGDYLPMAQNIEKDANLMAYLACRYYSLKLSDRHLTVKYELTFDEAYLVDFEYSVLKEETEKRERKNLYLKGEYSTDLELINLIIDKYFLFNVAANEGSPHDIHEVIINIFKNTLKAKRTEKFGIKAGYSYHTNLYEAANAANLNYTDIELTSNNSLSSNSMELGFSYLYRPSRHLSLFPHVRFNLHLMVNKMSDQKFSTVKNNKYEIDGYTYTENIVYDAVTSVKNSYGSMFMISSPIFGTGKSLTFELGLNAAIHFLEYEVNYTYEYEKFIGFWADIAGELFYRSWRTNHIESKIKSSDKKFIFRVLPVLNVYYNLFNNFNVEISGSYNFAGARLIYQY